MRKEIAFKNVLIIANRIKSVNGLIGTPANRFECFKIRRAYVFGSTVKGSPLPNDIDILIEGNGCGLRYTAKKISNPGNNDSIRYGAKTDREYLRRYGIRISKESHHTAYRFIKGNFKKISIHDFSVDGEIAHPRIMIYPRNDFRPWAESQL